MYTERNERGNDSLQILSVSIHHGVSSSELDSNTLGKRVRRSEDKSLYKRVQPGDLVFNMMRAWQGAIGVVEVEGMVSPAYISATPNDQIHPQFMDFLLRRSESVAQIDSLSYGLTDFRKRLYWDGFVNVSCRVPSVAEQRAIANFFRALDTAITTQKRQLDKLKELKKGYLQQMFPQTGEREPRVRVAGFSEPWQERKLGEIGSTFTGLSGKTKEDFGHGKAKYITYKNVFANPITSTTELEQIGTDENQNEVRYGDIFFTTSSETPEEVGMSSVWLHNRENVYLNSFCFGYRQTKSISPYYMAFMLRSPYMRTKIQFLAQGISRYNISKTKMMDLTIPLSPQYEQTVIGNFFRILDNLIAAQQKKLGQLKQLKSGYLQKMFI